MIRWAAIALVLAALLAQGGDGAWKASVAALIAGQALDAASAWGQPELNPILGERFGWRGVAVKAGTTAAALGVQWPYRKQMPRLLTVVNFAAGTALGFIAARNFSIR